LCFLSSYGYSPILVIVVSALNDILDFATSYFPRDKRGDHIHVRDGHRDTRVFRSSSEEARKREGHRKNGHEKTMMLLAASLVESLPVFGLLPFQTIGAVVMAMIKPGA
jgi:hypothetical protein